MNAINSQRIFVTYLTIHKRWFHFAYICEFTRFFARLWN